MTSYRSIDFKAGSRKKLGTLCCERPLRPFFKSIVLVGQYETRLVRHAMWTIYPRKPSEYSKLLTASSMYSCSQSQWVPTRNDYSDAILGGGRLPLGFVPRGRLQLQWQIAATGRIGFPFPTCLAVKCQLIRSLPVPPHPYYAACNSLQASRLLAYCDPMCIYFPIYHTRTPDPKSFPFEAYSLFTSLDPARSEWKARSRLILLNRKRPLTKP